MPHSLYSDNELEKGLELVSRLMDAGALKAIDDARLNTLVSKGLVGTICPDGDHALDIFNHASRFTRRLHLPGLNGGAILLSPLNKCFDSEGRSIMVSIEEAWEFGKGSAIGLFSHFPCGRAKKLDLPIHQVILDTIAAKHHVAGKMKLDRRIVIPFFHVDWTPLEDDVEKKERRTYIIQRTCEKILQPDGTLLAVTA